MVDYRKLYTNLFNDVTDEIGEHIQKLQEIQQKSVEAFAEESLPVKRARTAKTPPKQDKSPPE